MAAGRNFDYKLCQSLQRLFILKDTKTIFIFGIAIGLIPCLPFLSALSYIGLVSRKWPDSFIYSLIFGLGTAVSPLFILSIFTGLIPRILREKNRAYNIFNSLCGLIISFLGLRLILKGL